MAIAGDVVEEISISGMCVCVHVHTHVHRCIGEKSGN